MKFSFNNEGFSSLQNELYQLPDEALKVESEFALHDFISWMENHFMLTEYQLIFLNAIDDRVKKLLSFDTSFAVENRLPISLKMSDNVHKIQGKIIWRKSTLTAQSSLTSYEACGTLQISINYER